MSVAIRKLTSLAYCNSLDRLWTSKRRQREFIPSRCSNLLRKYDVVHAVVVCTDYHSVCGCGCACVRACVPARVGVRAVFEIHDTNI